MSTSSSGTGIDSAGPAEPLDTKKPMKAPTMYTSPWAKLSSFSTP